MKALLAAYMLAQSCCSAMYPVMVWVLELDKQPITFDDMTESECQALYQALWPHLINKDKLECVSYGVYRQRG